MDTSPRQPRDTGRAQLQTSPVTSPRQLEKHGRQPVAPTAKPPSTAFRPSTARSKLFERRLSKGEATDGTIQLSSASNAKSLEEPPSLPESPHVNSESLQRLVSQLWSAKEEAQTAVKKLHAEQNRSLRLERENLRLMALLQAGRCDAPTSLQSPSRRSSCNEADKAAYDGGFMPLSPREGERDAPPHSGRPNKRLGARSAGSSPRGKSEQKYTESSWESGPSSPRQPQQAAVSSSFVCKLKEQLEVYKAALAHRETELLSMQASPHSTASPHHAEHEELHLTYRREINRLQVHVSALKNDLIREISDKNGVAAKLQDALKDHASMKAKLLATEAAASDAQRTLKQILRSDLKVGDHVEVLVPESAEGSEYGRVLATDGATCLVQFESGAQLHCDVNIVFTRVVKPQLQDDEYSDDEDHDSGPSAFRIAQLLEHKCHVLQKELQKCRAQVEALVIDRANLELKLRGRESADRADCDSGDDEEEVEPEIEGDSLVDEHGNSVEDVNRVTEDVEGVFREASMAHQQAAVAAGATARDSNPPMSALPAAPPRRYTNVSDTSGGSGKRGSRSSAGAGSDGGYGYEDEFYADM